MKIKVGLLMAQTNKQNKFKGLFPIFRVKSRKGRIERGRRSSLRAPIWLRRKWETLVAGGLTRRTKLLWTRGWRQIAQLSIKLQAGVKQVNQIMHQPSLSTQPTLLPMSILEHRPSPALRLAQLPNLSSRHKESNLPNKFRVAERLDQTLKSTNSNNEVASCWSLPISKALVRSRSLKSKLFYKNVIKVKVNH